MTYGVAEALARMAHTGVLMRAIAPGQTVQTNTPGISVDGAEVRRRLVEGMLATPTGRAMSALIEAAVAWHRAYGDRWDAATSDKPEPEPRIEADATLALYAAVETWLALGDET